MKNDSDSQNGGDQILESLESLSINNKTGKKMFSKSERTEQKWWGILKSIPLVGTIYGGIRAPIYKFKGHRDEARRSYAGSLGNLLGTGAAIAGALVSGPLIIPVLTSIVGGGVVQQVVGGGGEVIVDCCNGDFQKKSGFQKESVLYDKIFKDIPVIGGVYSIIRAGMYRTRNNPEEAKRSIRNFVVNEVSSGISIGLGYAAAKVAVGVSSSSKLAKVAEPCKIIAKDTLKTSSSLASIVVHEIEEACFDLIPQATDIVVQVIIILENSIFCHNCKITNRLSFIVVNFLNEEFRKHFMSSSFLSLGVLRAGIPFLQAILCFKPNLQEHIGLAREFVQIAEEELQSEDLSAVKRVDLEIRLKLVRYFLHVLDPHSKNDGSSHKSNSCQQDVWSSNPQFTKYLVRIDEPIVYTPILKTNLDKTGLRILNLDGGGTRGLLQLEFLEEMELRTNRKICECFDYISGTSTGGIIALSLALGRTVSNVRNLYFNLKNKVFKGRKPYNHKILEIELKNAFGEDKTMKDIMGVKVLITASMITNKSFVTKLLTNFDSETWSIPIWEVVRCTTAVPTYFESHHIASLGKTFYDGGLGANNPTMSSIYMMLDHRTEMKNAVIVSLGTGRYLDPNPNESPLKLENPIKRLFNGDLKRFVDILIEQVSKSDDEPVVHAHKTCRLMQSSYYRLTPIIPQDVDLDETDDEILINLIFHTKAYIASNINIISEICERLIL